MPYLPLGMCLLVEMLHPYVPFLLVSLNREYIYTCSKCLNRWLCLGLLLLMQLFTVANVLKSICINLGI